MYISVVVIFSWPRINWIVLRSAPFFKRWDANECLNVWGLIFLVIPDFLEIFLIQNIKNTFFKRNKISKPFPLVSWCNHGTIWMLWNKPAISGGFAQSNTCWLYRKKGQMSCGFIEKVTICYWSNSVEPRHWMINDG